MAIRNYRRGSRRERRIRKDCHSSNRKESTIVNSPTFVFQIENFLLAGGNCSEDHACMKRYAKMLVHDFDSIKSKAYHIKGKVVAFSFEMVPADMKWLATFSWELGNASYYFPRFVNVSNYNKHTVNGSLGPEPEIQGNPGYIRWGSRLFRWYERQR